MDQKCTLISIIFLYGLLILSCGNTPSDYNSAMIKKDINNSDSKMSFPYDLNNPIEKYTLPENLTEVSGIAYFDGNKILCIQDEKADIFVLDFGNKKILEKYRFGKDGDFEDIAVVDQTVYVLRSDGHIFEIENFDKKSIRVTDHNTPLSSKNDTEGLTYDIQSNSLLIACKGTPDIKDSEYRKSKAVYYFDLQLKKLKREPAFLVDLKTLDGFKPSGIAICPVTEEIYLISGSNRVLISVGRDGKTLGIYHLDPALFRQPEGICFSPTGELYISNEGSGRRGNIYKFIRH